MANVKEADPGDRQERAPEPQTLKANEAQVARATGAADLASAEKNRTNTSDGSLRRYSKVDLAAQEQSIELVHCDRVASRISGLTEKEITAKSPQTFEDEVGPQIALKPDELLKGAQQEFKKLAKEIVCTDKGHEDAKMHYLDDFNAFYTTDLTKYNIDPFVIAAITRNEIEHRKAGIDDLQDEQIKKLGTVIAFDPAKASIGNQQMQPQNIKRLVNARNADGGMLYPQLECIKTDPLKKALNPHCGSLLLGAYLQDVARRLEAGEDPIPSYDKAHKQQIIRTMISLWQSGDPEKRTDALIRGYNPGDGQEHVDNVRRHLRAIKQTVGKLFL